MSDRTLFAYAQARLNARHGDRADEATWRRLQSIGDLGSYLQLAQRTSLRSWVLGLHASTGSHDIENALRRQFREYIDDVGHWLPGSWAASVYSVKRVVDLPALQYLLDGGVLQPWMLDDPALRPFASENVAVRLDAVAGSDCGYVVSAWKRGIPLYRAWLDNWRGQWPSAPRFARGVEAVARLFEAHIHALASGTTASGQLRDALRTRLAFMFRRYSFQPAAAFAHLALVALDLQILRGALVRRALVPEQVRASA